MLMFCCNLEGLDILRGINPFSPAVCGNGGRGASNGEIWPLAREGRRPGCDDARFRPATRGTVLGGTGDPVGFGAGRENVDGDGDSVGEGLPVEGGADILARLL